MAENPDAKKASPVRIFGLFGALGAAFSLFSFAERLFQFGLSPVMADFVDYYRQVGVWVFGWIGYPFGVDVPVWLRDLWILSAVGTGLLVRGMDWDKGRAETPEGFHPDTTGPITLAFICLGITLSLIGLLGLLILILAFLLIRDRDNRQFRREGVLLLLALASFFALNAYAPGA